MEASTEYPYRMTSSNRVTDHVFPVGHFLCIRMRNTTENRNQWDKMANHFLLLFITHHVGDHLTKQSLDKHYGRNERQGYS